MLLVGVYVCGFLVVSVHLASYGIVEFELLRPRVISAGVLFLIFLAVSASVASYVYDFFGSKGLKEKRDFEAGTSVHGHILYNLSVKSILFWDLFTLEALTACFMAIPLGIFEPHARIIWYYLSVAIIWSTLNAAFHIWFSKKPILCGGCAFFALTLGVAGLVVMKMWTELYLVAWFVISGRMSAYIVQEIRVLVEGRGVNLHKWFLGTLGVIVLFAVGVYPKVVPVIGGGSPVAIGLQFTDKSPLDGSLKPRVWLIDETDKGFYVLRSKEDKKGIFLRRELVSAVYYGD